MFEVGTYIVCGCHGVCKVESIGHLEFMGGEKSKLYYTLSRVYQKSSLIYIPADNDKIIMRPVLKRENAEAFFGCIKGAEIFWIANEKRREEVFRTALRTCDCVEWVKIIKTIYERKQVRISQGKKAVTGDEKYLHSAEENLYGELAISLDMDRNHVERYITEQIEQNN